MKRWHAKTIGDCDVHRDIYEEGNPKPIAPPIMFDAANALVAAHNGEQDCPSCGGFGYFPTYDSGDEKIQGCPKCKTTGKVSRAPLPANKARYEQSAPTAEERYTILQALQMAAEELQRCAPMSIAITALDEARKLVEAAPSLAQEKPQFRKREHLVPSAGYWFEGSRKAQAEGKHAEAVAFMENAYNHVENALAAAQEKQVEASVEEALQRLEHECLITAERESGLCKDITLVCSTLRALATASSPSEDTKRQISILLSVISLYETGIRSLDQNYRITLSDLDWGSADYLTDEARAMQQSGGKS